MNTVVAWKNRIVGTGEEAPDQLLANPRNWRIHPKYQQDALEAVLGEVGWVQNVIVNQRSGRVVDGHLRVSVALRRDEPTVPVVYVDLTDNEEALILASIDPLAAMAVVDEAKLAELLEEIETNSPELQKMLKEIAEENGVSYGATGEEVDAEPQIDRAAELQEKWKTERGQVWQLGEHRLMCGDSTDKSDVGALLGDCRPFLMVTDPPYGVEYDPEWRDGADLGIGQRSKGKVANDDRVDWTDAYKLFTGHVAYVWHAGKFAADLVVNLRDADFEIRTQVIWAKQHFAMSRGHYHWQHEPCWYAVRKGGTSKWCGDRTQSTVWNIANNNAFGGGGEEKHGHGTQKPVECMARPIRNHGGKDDDVYDPFVGSGTTIIAAEQLGRRCFAMELEPGYVAVCLQRFVDATGKEPTLLQ